VVDDHLATARLEGAQIRVLGSVDKIQRLAAICFVKRKIEIAIEIEAAKIVIGVFENRIGKKSCVLGVGHDSN
jgi:hypothetical protein